eukprot:scaffold13771_cov105-Isochrysis_galbana.AAC.2
MGSQSVRRRHQKGLFRSSAASVSASDTRFSDMAALCHDTNSTRSASGKKYCCVALHGASARDV